MNKDETENKQQHADLTFSNSPHIPSIKYTELSDKEKLFVLTQWLTVVAEYKRTQLDSMGFRPENYIHFGAFGVPWLIGYAKGRMANQPVAFDSVFEIVGYLCA